MTAKDTTNASRSPPISSIKQSLDEKENISNNINLDTHSSHKSSHLNSQNIQFTKLLGNQHQQQQLKQQQQRPSYLSNSQMPIACKPLVQQQKDSLNSSNTFYQKEGIEFQFDSTVRLKELSVDSSDKSELTQFVHQWQNKLDGIAGNWPSSLTESIPIDLFIELVDQTQTNLLLLGQLIQSAEQKSWQEKEEDVGQLKANIVKLTSALQEYALLYKTSITE